MTHAKEAAGFLYEHFGLAAAVIGVIVGLSYFAVGGVAIAGMSCGDDGYSITATVIGMQVTCDASGRVVDTLTVEELLGGGAMSGLVVGGIAGLVIRALGKGGSE